MIVITEIITIILVLLLLFLGISAAIVTLLLSLLFLLLRGIPENFLRENQPVPKCILSEQGRTVSIVIMN